MASTIVIPSITITARGNPRTFAAMLQSLDEYVRVNKTLVEVATELYRDKDRTRIVQKYYLPDIDGTVYVETFVFDDRRPVDRLWFSQNGHQIEIDPDIRNDPGLAAQFAMFPGRWTVAEALNSVLRLKYELALRLAR